MHWKRLVLQPSFATLKQEWTQNHEHKSQSNSFEVPVTIPAFIAVEITIKNSTFLAHMISKTAIILVYFFRSNSIIHPSIHINHLAILINRKVITVTWTNRSSSNLNHRDTFAPSLLNLREWLAISPENSPYSIQHLITSPRPRDSRFKASLSPIWRVLLLVSSPRAYGRSLTMFML